MTDRESIIKKCQECIDSGEPSLDYHFYYAIIRLLKEQPEPPHVVTCEECTHWDKKSGLSARWCETWKTHTMRREWCSRGIRKDEVQR